MKKEKAGDEIKCCRKRRRMKISDVKKEKAGNENRLIMKMRGMDRTLSTSLLNYSLKPGNENRCIWQRHSMKIRG
jgi:hypothetical protein